MFQAKELKGLPRVNVQRRTQKLGWAGCVASGEGWSQQVEGGGGGKSERHVSLA